MAKRKRQRVRTGRRRANEQRRGPSLFFYIALILGLIALAWLGYTASTTEVTPPSVPDLDYSEGQ